MAVSSWRMRNEVMCVSGALPSADVYLCMNFGRRRLMRSMRDCEVGGVLGVASAAYRRRVGGLRRCCGGRAVARNRGRRNIVVGLVLCCPALV